MAAYGISGSKYDSARFRKRKCEKWSRHNGHGARMVWILAADSGYDRVAGHDTEYPAVRQVNG